MVPITIMSSFLLYWKLLTLVVIKLTEKAQLHCYVAGLTAVLFTYPLDVVRSRIAFQVHGEHIYSGFVNAVQSIYRDGGVYGLYKGMTPTLLGMVPYAGRRCFCAACEA